MLEDFSVGSGRGPHGELSLSLVATQDNGEASLDVIEFTRRC